MSKSILIFIVLLFVSACIQKKKPIQPPPEPIEEHVTPPLTKEHIASQGKDSALPDKSLKEIDINESKPKKNANYIKPISIPHKARIFSPKLDKKTVRLLKKLKKCKSLKKRKACEENSLTSLGDRSYQYNSESLNTLLEFVINPQNDAKQREIAAEAIRRGRRQITKNSPKDIINITTADALFYAGMPKLSDTRIIMNISGIAVRVNVLLGRHEMVKSYIHHLEEAKEDSSLHYADILITLDFALQSLLHIGGMRYWPLIKKHASEMNYSTSAAFEAIEYAMHYEGSTLSRDDVALICDWAEQTQDDGHQYIQLSRTIILAQCPERTRLTPIISKAIVKYLSKEYSADRSIYNITRSANMLCQKKPHIYIKEPTQIEYCEPIKESILKLLNDKSNDSYERNNLMRYALPIFHQNPHGFLTPYLNDPKLSTMARDLIKSTKK